MEIEPTLTAVFKQDVATSIKRYIDDRMQFAASLDNNCDKAMELTLIADHIRKLSGTYPFPVLRNLCSDGHSASILEDFDKIEPLMGTNKDIIVLFYDETGENVGTVTWKDINY